MKETKSKTLMNIKKLNLKIVEGDKLNHKNYNQSQNKRKIKREKKSIKRIVEREL